jgi:hypothetical protein
MDVKERAGRGWEGNGEGLREEGGRGQGWSCVKAAPHWMERVGNINRLD